MQLWMVECHVVLFDYWIFHNRSSKIIGQEVSIIIQNYHMKGKPIECLSLYCLKLISLLKNVSVMLFYAQYQIPQLVLTANSI